MHVSYVHVQSPLLMFSFCYYTSTCIVCINYYIEFDLMHSLLGSFVQPQIGEHTLQVLKELNFTEKMISELVKSNVVYQCEPNAKL